MSIAAANNEQRWSRGSWFTLALAVAYLLGGVVYALAAFQQPTDGWNSAYDATNGWVPVLNQGGADVLHAGDRILAIEGQNIDMVNPPRYEPPPGWTIGTTARYTVVRDGQIRDLDVPLVRISSGALPRYILFGVDGTSFASLLALLSGFVIFLLRPGNVAARLLLLILTYFMGTASIWLASYTPAVSLFPPFLYWAYRITGIGWPLMFAMVAHVALAFPIRTWPLTRWPRPAAALLYSVAAAGGLLSLATSNSVFYIATLLLVIVAMAVAVIGATLHNVRSTRDPVMRAQIGWVALGLLGSFVLAAISAVVGLLVPKYADTGGYISFLALPLCLGIAITRYRLFDIEVIIRRTLVYSMLTLTLGLIYVGCILISQALAARLTGTSDLATVISTLVIAALFFPLRRRIQNIIDRRFYRKKYNAQQVLAAFALAARDETDLNALTTELGRVVNETVQPEFVSVWLREPQEKPVRTSD